MVKAELKKTNAMRVLEANRVPYTVKVYDERGEFHSADEAAVLIGAPAASVYKTLVVLSEDAARGGARKKPYLVMVASDREIELRLLAKSLGEKKLRMATKKEAEQLTGAQIGGISALALLNRGFEICLDQRALQLETVHVSGGMRGLDLELRVADLVRVTRARPVQAAADEPLQGTETPGKAS